MELEMEARVGIEPTTRGFSVARRDPFGTGKPKTGHEFSPLRPNREPNCGPAFGSDA